jgi:TonB family protein
MRVIPTTTLLSLCLLAATWQTPAYAQQPEQVVSSGAAQEGMELYQQGEIKKAIKLLREAIKRDKKDGDAWYYLGLALQRSHETHAALDAFRNAANLRPDFAGAKVGLAYALYVTGQPREATGEAERALALDKNSVDARYVLGAVQLSVGAYMNALQQAEAALKIEPEFPAGLLLKSRALLGLYANEPPLPPSERDSAQAFASRRRKQIDRLREAHRSLEKYLQLSPTSAIADSIRAQLEALQVYAQDETNPAAGHVPASSREVAIKARIKSKPEPMLPGNWEQVGSSGRVVLLAVLADDGQVKNVLVLQSPNDQLTEASMKAARKIKFTPAIKDGRPVSQYVQIEYNFIW